MLIEAAVRCLARDGIQGFTIERICREAGVSRGLIGHYFGGKDGLLVAVYRGALYDAVMTRLAALARAPDADGAALGARLAMIIDAVFAPEFFSRDKLRVWLALWGEIAGNPALRTAHRELYGDYRGRIAAEIGRIGRARGLGIDPDRMALAFLALVDGLWLEWCLDDVAVDPAGARAVARAMLEAELGPLQTG